MRAHRTLWLGLLLLLLVTPAWGQGTLFVEGNNVGIGTATPAVPLHIANSPSTSVIRVERAGPGRLEFRDTAGGVSWDFRTTSGDAFVLTKVGTGVNEMVVNSVGDLVIPGDLKAMGGDGSVDPGDTFPDYVFEADYPLMPLDELASFIERERHLPNVLSSEDVSREKGVNVSRLQLQLLEKVEELTLYILQQQAEIDELRSQLVLNGEPR